jgi:hypothetical protein
LDVPGVRIGHIPPFFDEVEEDIQHFGTLLISCMLAVP